MAKRIYVDTLAEVRKALRVLRRLERAMVQELNAQKRAAVKAAERRELASLAELARSGNGKW